LIHFKGVNPEDLQVYKGSEGIKGDNERFGGNNGNIGEGILGYLEGCRDISRKFFSLDS